MQGDNSSKTSAGPAGRVSVIIPARNEEANIERVVRSLAKQDEVREIIVVDDDSSDRTGEILNRLQAEIPALSAVRNQSLPPGWTGKSFAAATAARLAKGDWLLFTDADTVHEPESLRTLLTRAESAGADLLSVSPGQETPTWWEKAIIPRVYVQLARWYPFEETSQPESSLAAANGQYILVRKDAYRRAGGFESVRDEVLDDVAFAERIKRQGGRILFLPGAGWVRTRMYRRFTDMWQGWTKNLYPLAGSDSRQFVWALAACFADFMPAAAYLALAGWVLAHPGPIAVSAFCACLLVLLLQMQAYARHLERLGYDDELAYSLALGSALLALLLLNSWRAHRLRHRIEWKGRTYPAARRSGKE